MTEHAPPLASKPADSGDSRRELVFGFVSPIGCNRDVVEDALRVALCSVEYAVETIHVSDLLQPFAPKENPTPHVPEFLTRKKLLMDAGDRMRQEFSAFVGREPRGDAAALAAVFTIREKRLEKNGSDNVPADAENRMRLTSTPLVSTAFLVNSLKHPDELRLLKRIYGPAFISIGIYVPPEMRKSFLLEEADVDESEHDVALFADKLLARDENGQDDEGNIVPLGQDTSDAFYTTDFIVDATKPKHEVVAQLTRLVELIFGDLCLAPSREELGMFIAHAAQVRSGSLARQIGASILRDDGSVVSVGTNEVARPISGGQYWFEDDHLYAGRDAVYQPRDTSDEFREEMVADLLWRLDEAGALAEKFSVRKSADELSETTAEQLRKHRLETLYFNENAPLRKAVLRNNLDYVRTVHAEGAAIIDAARHGVPTWRATMFTTTFPCHECARHIVAAGIKEVVYLAPYPKSAVKRLYRDSIQVDPRHHDERKVLFRTFVGVAPSRYLEFFTAVRERKSFKGYREKFDLRKESPHLPYYTPDAKAAASNNEPLELSPFIKFLEHRSDNPTPPPTPPS